MEENVLETTPEKKARPSFLTVLCILTFIVSGLVVLSNLVAIFAFGMMEEMAENISQLAIVLEFGRSYFAISALLSALSLVGAILMWNLKKTGFWLYTAVHVLIVFVPVLYGSWELFSILGLIITAGFIAMYGANLKYME